MQPKAVVGKDCRKALSTILVCIGLQGLYNASHAACVQSMDSTSNCQKGHTSPSMLIGSVESHAHSERSHKKEQES